MGDKEFSEKEPHFKVTLKDVYNKVEAYQACSDKWRGEIALSLLNLRTYIEKHNGIKEDLMKRDNSLETEIEIINTRCKKNLYDETGAYPKIRAEIKAVEQTVSNELQEIKKHIVTTQSYGAGKSAVEGAFLRWLPAIIGVAMIIMSYLAFIYDYRF